MTATLIDRQAVMQTFGVPAGLREGLALYIEHGVPTGSFLEAVLSNNLREAVSRGDNDSRAGLASVVLYLANDAPIACWGSPAAFSAWRGHHGLEGWAAHQVFA